MSLSLKLGVVCAAAALSPLIIATLIVLPQISSSSRRLAIENLQSESRAAAGLYEKRLAEMRAAVQRLAGDIASRALVSNDTSDASSPAAWARLQDMLPRAQNDHGLDFVIIADPQGRVIARHNDRPAQGETLFAAEEKNPVAEKAISGNGQPVAAAVIERGERLARLGLDRVAQVKMADGSTVDEALMIEAAAPVVSGGRLIGVALAGQMLNNYSKLRPGASSLQNPLVAEIRQTLYRSAEADAGALIAFNSAIVASSIPPAGGSDSLLSGVRRDPARSEETIRHGDQSYIAVWQPIKSLDNAEIASLGIARNAAELEGQKNSARAALFTIAMIASALAGIAGFFYGRALAVRLNDLAQAANRWTLGELSAAAKDSDPVTRKGLAGFIARDEISRLAAQLDEMRESFRQAIERLRKR